MTTRSLNSRVHSWCRSKYDGYVVFTKSIKSNLFILGLILSYKLVENTFLSILITVLNNAWDEYDLRTAVMVVNLQEGATGVLAIFFAYAADVWTGRFKMLLSSSAVCIMGLSLSIAAAVVGAGDTGLKLLYPALVLMTLAQAAQIVTLQPFLEDQLRRLPTGSASTGDGDGDGDGKTAWRRRLSRFMSNRVSVMGLVAAILSLLLVKLEFKDLAIVLTVLMLIWSSVFLLGTQNYNFVATIENPFKRKVEYPQTPEGFSGNSIGDMHVSPRIPRLRWLDRAAVVQEQEIQRGKGSPSRLEEVMRRVKLLLKILPLWFILLTIGLVSASGSTFFFEEALSLSGDSLTPILLLSYLQRFTEYWASKISSYIIEKLRKKRTYNEQKMELVRIGIGLSCCVPCCVAAWATASARMRHKDSSSSKNTDDSNSSKNTDDSNSMNVYLLTPQFLFLGIMGGLCTGGFQLFYESQVSETFYRFGPPFEEFMMGLGKFTCLLCSLIFSQIGWFQSKLYNSRLDRYYIFLAVLSLCNVVLFCLVARWYGDDDFLIGGDEEMGIAADQVGQVPEEVVRGDEEMGNADEVGQLLEEVIGGDIEMGMIADEVGQLLEEVIGGNEEMGNADEVGQLLEEVIGGDIEMGMIADEVGQLLEEVIGGNDEMGNADEVGQLLEEVIGGDIEMGMIADEVGQLEEVIGGNEEMRIADEVGQLVEEVILDDLEPRAIEGPRRRFGTSGDFIGELPEVPLLQSASTYSRWSSDTYIIEDMERDMSRPSSASRDRPKRWKRRPIRYVQNN